MAEKKSKPSIEEIIAHRRNCLATEESDREALTEYIRNFAKSKRGNMATLTRESGIPQSKISNMLNGTGTSAGMETLVILALTIKNISER
ncbi:XRE family transcriptional regulator (plasmid) [Leptospira interrogans]|nr:XRE family transcriptional regulator [Leptospira interrogans]ULG90676.1 XRE family transcriptional regulator [Leptospira interrogans]ULG90705.1 XRE family transcriptional regulator [Leptospira interrogans]UML78395.1 XRE family transcriptional regulator [Leptospira interrogans]UML78451.1 XRE family transcriptional regulator [Leptospira interrogans]